MLHLKSLITLFIPLSLLFVGPAKADVIQWEDKKEKIEDQREDIQKELEAAETKIDALPDDQKEEVINQTIKLSMEDNKLAAYQTAYEKAIELQIGRISTGKIKDFSFVPIKKLLPGQTAPSEYIPIYKAAGERYGVDWFVLAAIHKIETNFSRVKVMISSVNAQGHMQFMPATFKAYGVDGNGDGIKSAWNLQDAIFSAAHYLSESGYSKDIRKAIWHYNHATWYVNDVIETATRIKSS